MATESQSFRDLAGLLDSLTKLTKNWLQVVAKPGTSNSDPLRKHSSDSLYPMIESFRAIKIPFSDVSPASHSSLGELVTENSFEDQLAALSSLELPQFTQEQESNALKALQDAFNQSTSNLLPPSSNDSPSQGKPSPATLRRALQSSLDQDDNDPSNLTLPSNYDDFFLPEPKKSKIRGGTRLRRSKQKKGSNPTATFDMNFFAAINAQNASPSGSSSSVDANPPGERSSELKTSLDTFGLSSLDQLSSALRTEDSQKEPQKQLSYDDFFAGLNKASEISGMAELPPRGDRLIRAYATKEDMNRRGMQRAKKKSQVDAKGQGVYQMEDANYSSVPFNGNDDMALFCVFDGHVDKNASRAATELFPEELAKNLAAYPLGSDAGELLRATFLSTDLRMKPYDVEGTTATAVFFWRVGSTRYVQTANVGDSTAFLCRDGKSIMLSKDHKVNEESERKRLLECGLDLNKGQNRINGLAVSRALGDHFIKDNFAGVTAEPFLSEVYELDDTDTLLIVASDGLWDTMSGQDAMDAVKRMRDPQTMANNLVNMATSSGLCNDNITVTVVML